MTITYKIQDNRQKQHGIEFTHSLDPYSGQFECAEYATTDWDAVVLIFQYDDFDLMYAYDNDSPQRGVIYKGRWNSGKVTV